MTGQVIDRANALAVQSSALGGANAVHQLNIARPGDLLGAIVATTTCSAREAGNGGREMGELGRGGGRIAPRFPVRDRLGGNVRIEEGFHDPALGAVDLDEIGETVIGAHAIAVMHPHARGNGDPRGEQLIGVGGHLHERA